MRFLRNSFLALTLGASLAGSLAATTNHWAFEPLSEAPPPAVKHRDGCRTPIDSFILAKLDQIGTPPSPPAEPQALVRRIYFDLIGLPPTPGEVEEFIATFRRDRLSAVETLTERLLDSPHYGERWGRWWLDVARYADTNGQDENKVMANAWRYRDWVIRSFNANLPFNRFITEQLAGDLLPPAAGEPENFDRLIATGFLVLGPKMLAEQDKPKLVMDIVDEQVDTVGRAFLGLTLGCARCHDHKFDPVPARDYYAMAGIFKSTRTMANLAFVSKFNESQIATQAELAAIQAHQGRLTAQTNRIDALVREANHALVTEWQKAFPRYLAAAPSTNSPPSDLSTNLLQNLRGLLGSDPATNTVSRTLRALTPDQAEPFLEALTVAPDASAVQLAPGKVGGAFHATGKNHLELPHTAELDPPQLTVEAWVRVDSFPREGDTRRWLVNKNGNEWTQGHYALLVDRGQAGAYLNIGGSKDDVFSVWSGSETLPARQWNHLAFTYDGQDLRLWVNGKAVAQTSVKRPRVAGKSALVLGRRQDGYIHFIGDLDEVHVFDRALSPTEVQARFTRPGDLPGEHVVAAWEFNQLTAAEQKAMERGELREALLGQAGLFSIPKDPRPLYPAATRDALAVLEKERDALVGSAPPGPAQALSVADDKPVDLPIHLRGSHLNLAKDPVPRGFVQVVARRGAVPRISPDHSGRLELARWLTSPDNPLTARVIVNRLWQGHFGEGLVRTPDNFGVRGSPPTHPELLDWLAREFIRSGWDVKALHRLIVRSAVFQQSSRSSPDSTDPENRFLSRFPRQRFDAEMIRDSVLAIAESLDPALGGTLVNWKNDEYAPGDEVSAKSARRTIYLPIVRDRVFDALTIFDFANPSVCTAQRTATVVSHQALFFLNSPLVKESAETVARSLLARTDWDDATRVREAYQRILNRPATTAEVERAMRFLAELPPGKTAAETKSDRRPDDFAALCQTLFASNEFVYRF